MRASCGACHLSGYVRPSDADLAVTRRLASAGWLLEIELLDHVVWARDGAFRSIDQMCPEAFGPRPERPVAPAHRHSSLGGRVAVTALSA
jgi:hypothetical protein